LACHDRDALEGQRTTQDLPYGLNVWHAGTQVLSVLWAEDGAFKELNRIGFRLYEGSTATAGAHQTRLAGGSGAADEHEPQRAGETAAF